MHRHPHHVAAVAISVAPHLAQQVALRAKRLGLASGDLELLAEAALWADHHDESFAAHERAFQAHVRSGVPADAGGERLHRARLDQSSRHAVHDQLVGTADPGTRVRVAVDGKVAGMATTSAAGTWQLRISTPLPRRSYLRYSDIAATATDGYGNKSPTTTTTLTTDTRSLATLFRDYAY